MRYATLFATLLLCGCAPALSAGPASTTTPSAATVGSSAEPSTGASSPGSTETELGLATWYSDDLAGHHTASGIPYDPHALTAAHRTLPLGTRVRVVRTDNGRAVEVQINDRGPFGSHRRIIDLSRAAATELRMLGSGVVPVRLEVLERGHLRYRRVR